MASPPEATNRERATQERPDFLIESHSIDFIPHHLRHGRARDLFPLWFGANASVTTPALGALIIYPGFSLLWAGVALLVGLLVGGVFTAYHSAQGPTLGLPQMIQSRAQFGFFGANLPLLIVVLMYLGYFATGAVLGGQAVADLFGVPVSVGIVVESLANVTLCLLGYRAIHKFQRFAAPTFIVVFGLVTALTISYVSRHDVALDLSIGGRGFQTTPFVLTVTLAVSYVISYGPYVADYSRYLPEGTSVKSTFWFTYSPLILGSIWLMGLGAILTSTFPSLGPVEQIAAVSAYGGEWIRVVALLTLIAGIAGINSLNIYGAFMSSVTITTSYFRTWKPGQRLRISFIVPVAVVATVAAFLQKDGVLNAFQTFLVLLVTFLVPWSVINLVDFYFVARRRYDIESLFDPASRYLRINSRGMAAYALGCAIQIPFVNVSGLYEGPVARLLGGADISWIVGAAVAGLVYLWLNRGRARSATLLVGIPSSSGGRP